jgi:translocation and assembly module TamB
MGNLPRDNDSFARAPGDPAAPQTADVPNAPWPERELIMPPRKPWPKWGKTAAKAAAGILGLGVLGFVGISWWVAKNLSPTIAAELSKALDRQVKVGPVGNIGFNEINFGASSLEPSVDSPSRIGAKGIKVSFDPLAILFQRTIKPNITIVEPDFYLEQNAQGDWIKIRLTATPPGQEGLFRTEIQTINFQKAQGTVIPYQSNGLRQPITVQNADFKAAFTNKNKTISLINFDGKGQLLDQAGKTGQISFQGTNAPIERITKAEFTGQSLNAKQISDLIKIPAMDFRSGTVSGQMGVTIDPARPLDYRGKLRVDNATMQIAQIPQLFERASGDIDVTAQAVQLSNVSMVYGQIPGQLAGKIDFIKGYEIQAQTTILSAPKLLENLQVKTPITVAGQVQTTINLSGLLNRPIVTGLVKTIGTSQIDKLAFNQLQSNFSLIDGNLSLANITISPNRGGIITGDGNITLKDKPQIDLSFRTNKIPADLLTEPYQKLPIMLGLVDATAQISGTPSQINTVVSLQAPQATYRPESSETTIAMPLTAQVAIAPSGVVTLQQAKIKIAGQEISGSGSLVQGRWQAQVKVPPIDSQSLAVIAQAKDFPSYLRGQVQGTMQLTGSIENSEKVIGNGLLQLKTAAGNFSATQVILNQGKWQTELQTTDLILAKLDPQLSGRLTGKVRVSGNTTKSDLATILATGSGVFALPDGRIKAQNLLLAKGKWQGEFSTDNFDLSKLSPQPGGKLAGRFVLNGDIEKTTIKDIQGSGTGTLRLATGELVGKNLRLSQGNWQGEVAMKQLPLGQLSPAVPQPWRSALLNGNLQVAGSIEQPTKAVVRGNAALNIGGGQIMAQDLQVGNGRWQGLFDLKSINLNQLPLALPKNIQGGAIDGQFVLTGTIDQPRLETAKGSGRLRLPGAELVAQELELNGNDWQGKFQTTNVRPGQFAILPPAIAQARVTSSFALSGNLLNPQEVSGGGSGQVALGNSQIAVQQWQLAGGNWQVAASTNGLQLRNLGAAVPANIQNGIFTGSLNLGGVLDKPQIEAINGDVAGQLALWGGSIAMSPIKIANGRWAGQVSLRNLELNRFGGGNLPALAGRISGEGQAAGRLDRFNANDLTITSQISLNDLRVGNLTPESQLQGQLNTAGGKIALELKGQRDLLSLNSTDQGLAFVGKVAGMEAEGSVDKKQLLVNARGIPVPFIASFLPSLPQINKQQLKGIIAGELAMDLRTGRIEGKNISIDNPQVGILVGDRLQSGRLSYADGLLIVQDGLFLRGENRYGIEGRIITNTKQPEYQLAINVDNGKLADVSNLFQIFSFEDVMNPFGDRQYGTAQNLTPQQIGGEVNTLQEQLERLAEVRRLQAIQAERVADNPIPDIRNLKGDFTGKIVMSNAAQNGVYVSFNVQGKEWSVDQYNLSAVNLQGIWQNNVLTLANLDLTATDAQFNARGKFGMTGQEGEISIKRFPAERLSTLFKLPIEVAGDVNIDAKVGGVWFNPKISGIATLLGGQLNQAVLPQIDTKFNYRNSRLDFISTGLISSLTTTKTANTVSPPPPINDQPPKLAAGEQAPRPEQLFISGSIPYRLPFAFQQPEKNDFNIDLQVQNQGMKALAVLSQQPIEWIDGMGKVDVKLWGKFNAEGKLASWQAKGDAEVRDATLQSSALPQNLLTAVTGKVNFNLDQINVESFQSKFGNGSATASGSIAIDKPVTIAEPLTINLSKLQLNLPDQYQGGIDGQLTLGGSVFSPVLGGELKLSNGRVLLPETSSTAKGSTSLTAPSETTSALRFVNLDLLLGENVQVEKAPILNFWATGKITLNGTMEDLKPEGTINLDRGQVNLFTSRFRLNGSNNTAKFTAERGLDPILSVNLTTKALETYRLPSLDERNERQDKRDVFSTSLGAVQSVRVDARVDGLASEATNRLELTSNPPRSKEEILILLGNGLGRLSTDENAIGIGLFNFAGSTVINGIQDAVSDLLGLSDFRIYPAVTRAEGSTTSTLGLAAEVGLDLNTNVSASVFKIITSNELPQFSLRYRINDQILIRGSSNLSNDSRAILEFERRF